MDTKLVVNPKNHIEVVDDIFGKGYFIIDWLSIHEGLCFLFERKTALNNLNTVCGDDPRYNRRLKRKLEQLRSAGEKYIQIYSEISELVGGYKVSKENVKDVKARLNKSANNLSYILEKNFGIGDGPEDGTTTDLLSYMFVSFFVKFEDYFEAHNFCDNMEMSYFESYYSSHDYTPEVRDKLEAFKLFSMILDKKFVLKPFPSSKEFLFDGHLISENPNKQALRMAFYRAYDSFVEEKWHFF